MKIENKDLINGNLLKKIIIFSIPVMFSGILQLLFNACDLMVVGRFSGDESLAAVGSTTSITSLLVNLFIGFSIAANILVAKSIGRKNKKDCHMYVHTSLVFSFLAGLFLTIIGIVFAKSFLVSLDTNVEVLDKATTYLRLYFAGSIFNLVYNFGAAIIRATGETKKPLYYLVISGIVNIILNLFFVLVCGLDVEGVAIATIISQLVSALMTIRYLVKSDEFIHVNFKDLKINKNALKTIIILGLPAGIQNSLFSISNIFIQKAVNSFNSTAIVAGNSASANIGGFITTAMSAFSQACITFTSQNYGAKKLNNCKKILYYSISCVIISGLFFGGISVFFGKPLLKLYTSGDEAIKYGFIRLYITGLTYFTCGIYNVFVSGLRGLGKSFTSMLISILGICGIRLLWIFTVFEYYHDLKVLYYCYPLSWIITSIIQGIYYYIVYKKKKKEIYIDEDELVIE